MRQAMLVTVRDAKCQHWVDGVLTRRGRGREERSGLQTDANWFLQGGCQSERERSGSVSCESSSGVVTWRD